MMILVYLIILFVSITAEPSSAEDIGILVLTMAFFAAEAHYALKNGGADLSQYVKLPVVTILIGGAVAYAGTRVRTELNIWKTKRPVEAMQRAVALDSMNRVHHGLFDEDGDLHPEIERQFYAMEFFEEEIRASEAHAVLERADNEAFGDVLSQSSGWFGLAGFRPDARDSITALTNGFEERVDRYLDRLPEYFQNIVLETETDRTRRRGEELKPLYDSLIASVRREVPVLKKELAGLADILSDPSYWDVMTDPPVIIRKDIRRWHNNVKARSARSIRIIKQSRQTFLAYIVLLHRHEVKIP